MAMSFLTLFCLVSVMIDQPSGVPASTGQLLVVTTESWRSTAGSLQRYQRTEKRWQPIGKAVPVSAGKQGLAWGRGLHRSSINARAKREGDGCAPAGIFAIGPAFGYASQAPARCQLPYRAISERDYFVDDPASADYNRWVTIPAGEANRPEKFWKSFERMRRRDRLYELGIVIQQNESPIVKGKGSAIFFHVWRAPGVATVGCTAMAHDDLLELLRWLDPKQRPLLVQAPASEIKNMLAITTMR
jgi:L,D-peptidoglycan transpeptidase YkuD (ErfK/YbiS/YcfS/YnhG family)